MATQRDRWKAQARRQGGREKQVEHRDSTDKAQQQRSNNKDGTNKARW